MMGKIMPRIVLVFFVLTLLAHPIAAAAGEPQISDNRWPHSAFPLRYRLNVVNAPVHTRSTFIAYGRIGIDDWARVEGSKLTACYRGATTSFSKTDEHILAAWTEMPAGVGGWAYYPPVGLINYNVRYADIYYRDRDNLRNLTLHENGHAIGFPHYFEDESVMAYKFIPQLTDFDRRLIRLNYPGQKADAAECCAKSDKPLALTTADTKASGANGHWCFASWLAGTTPEYE